MVTEKVKAAGEAAMTIAMGGTPRKVVRGTVGKCMPTIGGSQGLRSRRLRQGYTVGDRSAGRRSPMGQRL